MLSISLGKHPSLNRFLPNHSCYPDTVNALSMLPSRHSKHVGCLVPGEKGKVKTSCVITIQANHHSESTFSISFKIYLKKLVLINPTH